STRLTACPTSKPPWASSSSCRGPGPCGRSAAAALQPCACRTGENPDGWRRVCPLPSGYGVSARGRSRYGGPLPVHCLRRLRGVPRVAVAPHVLAAPRSRRLRAGGHRHRLAVPAHLVGALGACQRGTARTRRGRVHLPLPHRRHLPRGIPAGNPARRGRGRHTLLGRRRLQCPPPCPPRTRPRHPTPARKIRFPGGLKSRFGGTCPPWTPQHETCSTPPNTSSPATPGSWTATGTPTTSKANRPAPSGQSSTPTATSTAGTATRSTRNCAATAANRSSPPEPCASSTNSATCPPASSTPPAATCAASPSRTGESHLSCRTSATPNPPPGGGSTTTSPAPSTPPRPSRAYCTSTAPPASGGTTPPPSPGSASRP